MGSLNRKTERHSVFSRVLLVLGIGGMFIAACFDLFRSGTTHHFGIFQLAGFVVAAFVAVVGLRGGVLSHTRLRDGFLLATYLAGIFFMGLRAGNPNYDFHYGVLSDMHFSPDDAFINVMGFIPLGYLMASFLAGGIQRQRDSRPIILAVALCVLVSFVIEFVQSYLPGRSSSIIDLATNTVGAMIGVLFCLVERRALYETRGDTRDHEQG
jgi:peptidoglycan/LPS O-acetylase OafA/YrhL